MKKIFTQFFLTITLINSSPLYAMSNQLLTPNSVSPIKTGMTVKEAANHLRQFTLTPSTDGEGVPLISVTRNHHLLFQLYLDQQPIHSKFADTAKIQHIEVFDTIYHTKDGVHVGMTLSDIEKHYGKVQEIMRSEIESREYATFTQQPAGMTFRVMGKDDTSAGIYPNESNTTTQYHRGAYLYSIFIGK